MLTVLQLKALKPGPKPYKAHDSRGLYAHVLPSGTICWRVKYRFSDKEKTYTIGKYPQIDLKTAREACLRIHSELDSGMDPGAQKQLKKRESRRAPRDHFGDFATDWLKRKSREVAASTAAKQRSRLHRHLVPRLGGYRLTEITPRILYELGQEIQERGAIETGNRVVRLAGQILQDAWVQGLIETNPAAHVTRSLSNSRPRHRAAPTTPEEFRNVVRKIWSYRESPEVSLGLRSAVYLFVRPSELTMARWDQVDLTNRLWSFTTGKTGANHSVPLARQVVEMWEQLTPLTDRQPWVFGHAYRPNDHMRPNSLLSALRKVGVGQEEASVHGLRATARTLLVEHLGYREDLVEHQLSHTVRDPNRRAYNRTNFLPERREMMQAWADFIDGLRDE